MNQTLSTGLSIAAIILAITLGLGGCCALIQHGDVEVIKAQKGNQ